MLVAVDEHSTCPDCGVAMLVQKTVKRSGMTLAHGPFEVSETTYVCRSGCERDGKPVTARSAELAQLLLPRGTVGYDVLVYVGCQRFLHHRQREEIRELLKTQYGIFLSSGQVSSLVRRFLVYLEKMHWQSSPALRAALQGDGGWPMHVDATGEDGRGTVITILSGWRGWVLYAWKAPTERAEFVLPGMQRVAEAFGAPCAIMRDLGRAMTEAANEFVKFQGRPISILACHQHFLTDVGKDLLAKRHKQLGYIFSQLKLQPKLRLFVRQLGNRLGESIVDGREAAARWLLPNSPPPIPGGVAGITVVRAFAQYILDHHADSHGQKFPYALPWHNLHSRCLVVSTALEKFLSTPPDDVRVRKALEKFKRILDPVQQHPSLLLVSAAVIKRFDLFNRLRAALRLLKDGEKDSIQMLDDVKTAIERLTVDLKSERPQRGPATDVRQAIDIILAHLKRHSPYLSGHVINAPGGKILLVARTNNLAENEFHTVKHGERRRSGRKKLTQDFEMLPAAAVLAGNLRHPDYVSLVCGSLDRLPQAFAQLDVGDRSISIAAKASPELTKTETASLSTADKKFIRQPLFQNRILVAAQLQ
ncbi:MAG TPA: hypothetical protein VI386_21510 [Candidatus Sulfotelmatobacter sp.]